MTARWQPAAGKTQPGWGQRRAPADARGPFTPPLHSQLCIRHPAPAPGLVRQPQNHLPCVLRAQVGQGQLCCCTQWRPFGIPLLSPPQIHVEGWGRGCPHCDPPRIYFLPAPTQWDQSRELSLRGHRASPPSLMRQTKTEALIRSFQPERRQRGEQSRAESSDPSPYGEQCMGQWGQNIAGAAG